MKPILFLVLLLILLTAGAVAVVIIQRKQSQVKRFLKKHPESVWVWYHGPKDGVLVFSAIEGRRGIHFKLRDNRRGLLVLPGPIKVQISYYNSTAIKTTSFTQTLQFTAMPDRRYALMIDEKNRIMRALTL